MTIFQALILSIIEGITEFLPVSSTGHMIIGTALLGMTPTAFVKLFTVCIQFGAILSVVVLYWKRFFKSVNFYAKLFVAFIPAGVFGLLFDKMIDRMLGSVEVVAISLLLGGIILLFVDNIFKETEESEDKEITFLMALKIGFFQVISMIPGVSRSGATIVGGMAQKLSRRQAAEFSFFLAVPTMFAATAYKMFKAYKSVNDSAKTVELIKPHTIISTIHHVDPHNIFILILGNIVSFIIAMIAIKTFITFLTRHGFKLFGWYRIIVGAILLILVLMHVDIRVL